MQGLPFYCIQSCVSVRFGVTEDEVDGYFSTIHFNKMIFYVSILDTRHLIFYQL